MRRVLALLAVGLMIAPCAIAGESIFDAPLDLQKKTLPGNENAPETQLTCLYYPHFVVKQFDSGEIGAELSLVPIQAGAAKPPCRRDKAPGEKPIDPDAWGGYFKGARGDFAFFDAEDGVNGALGFAIFAPDTAKKLFEDSAKGELDSVTAVGSSLILRYTRSFLGECSVIESGGACWLQIAAATGLDPAKPPDCAAGYHDAKQDIAKERCDADGKKKAACLIAALNELEGKDWDEAVSVVTYPVETRIVGGSSTTKPLGPATACHPSD